MAEREKSGAEYRAEIDDAAAIVARWTAEDYEDFAQFMCGWSPRAVRSFDTGRPSRPLPGGLP